MSFGVFSADPRERTPPPEPIHKLELPQPGPYTLPGFGLPVNFEPQPERTVHRSLGPPTFQSQEVNYPMQGDGEPL